MAGLECLLLDGVPGRVPTLKEICSPSSHRWECNPPLSTPKAAELKLVSVAGVKGVSPACQGN